MAWGNWTVRGRGFFPARTSAVSWGEGRIDLFAIGNSSMVLGSESRGTGYLHRAFDGEWHAWEDIALLPAFEGAFAVAAGRGNLDAFSTTTGLTLVHRAFRDGRWGEIGGGRPRRDGTWPGRHAVDSLTSDPVVASCCPDRVDIAATNDDGSFVHMWTHEGAGDSGSVARPPGGVKLSGGSNVALVALALNRLHVFFLGTDGNLWHIIHTDRWRTLHAHDGPPGTRFYSPIAVRSASGYYLFVLSVDGRVWRRRWTSATNRLSDWRDLSHPTGARLVIAEQAPQLAAVSSGGDAVRVFVLSNGNIYQRSLSRTVGRPDIPLIWTPWRNLGHPNGAPLVGGLSAVAWGAERTDIFAVSADMRLWQRTFEAS